MPQVGVNDEPLLERLMFGYDGADYRVVKVDTSGNLVAAVLADQNVQARGHGWIGAAWQKQPLALGYSGDQTEQVQNLSASAGNNALVSAAVPAGELWIVQAVAAINSNTSITEIDLQVLANSVTVTLLAYLAPAAAQWVSWANQVVLAEGDQVRARFVNCTLNDDLYLTYHAVRVDIDQ